MKGLIETLRRRKVFRVATGYILVSWILLQVGEVLFPALMLPEWTLTLLAVLVILGFPIALILAWAYEITPQGVMRDSKARQLQLTDAGSNGNGSIPALGVNLAILGLVLVIAVLEANDRLIIRDPPAPSVSLPDPVVYRGKFNLGLIDRTPISNLFSNIALSNDGTRLAYTVYQDWGQKLYLRELSSLNPELLAEVPDASKAAFWSPAFSPDGERLVFQDINTSQIKTLVIREKQIQAIGDIGHMSTGFFWTEDQQIIFTAGNGYLSTVPAVGGPVESFGIPKLADGDIQSWASYLPDGEALLYTVGYGDSFANGKIRLFYPATGEVTTLLENGFNAQYVNSGHIVFIRTGTLWAVPFDPDSKQIVGLEIPVVTDIESSAVFAKATYAVSGNGQLVYLPGVVPIRGGDSVAWVDMGGNEQIIDLDLSIYVHPQAAPDGKKVAVIRFSDPDQRDLGGDLWVYNVVRGSTLRLTSGSTALRPVWSPDSQYLVYEDIARLGLWRVRADGTDQPVRISQTVVNQRPEAWVPDGDIILYRGYSSVTFDLFMLVREGDERWAEKPLIQSDNIWEAFAHISPDGRWVAYTSNETGPLEIYVRPFPNVSDGKWQVSRGGGEEPRWSPNGNEIFYRDRTGSSFMSVFVDTSSGFQYGPPVTRISGQYSGFGNSPSYDISANGERLLVLKSRNEDGPEKPVSLVIVNNWFSELTMITPISSEEF